MGKVNCPQPRRRARRAGAGWQSRFPDRSVPTRRRTVYASRFAAVDIGIGDIQVVRQLDTPEDRRPLLRRRKPSRIQLHCWSTSSVLQLCRHRYRCRLLRVAAHGIASSRIRATAKPGRRLHQPCARALPSLRGDVTTLPPPSRTSRSRASPITGSTCRAGPSWIENLQLPINTQSVNAPGGNGSSARTVKA